MSLTNNNVTKALIQAISSVAEEVAKNTPATLTVEAEIKDIIDEGKGIYTIVYLGNTFEAKASNNGVSYKVGERVFVLIQKEDLSKEKIIISSADSTTESVMYTPAEKEDFIILEKENLLNSNYPIGTIELSTYVGEERNLLDENKIEGFKELFNEALKDSRKFSLSCYVKTNIQAKNGDRGRGNYGLKLLIPVKQNNESSIFSVVLDTNNLLRDPYNFRVYAPQNYIFDFPEDMDYDEGKNIELIAFIENFPNQVIDKREEDDSIDETYPTDVWIKDIAISPSYKIEDEYKTGYYLSLKASGGSSFYDYQNEELKSTSKTISTELYLNGKTTSTNGFDCYWFKENSLININSEKYDEVGGIGWEILNKKTNTQTKEDGKEIFQYIKDDYSYIVQRNDIYTETRFKCVLIKDDKEISQIITIRDANKKNSLELFSATGTNIYTRNIGQAKIIVRYYEEKLNDTEMTINYKFLRFNKNGEYLDDNFYTIKRFNEKVEIDGKVYFETEINYDVNKIDESNIIYCTVFGELIIYEDEEKTIPLTVKQRILGTEHIALTVSEMSDAFTVIVNGGNKLYKYDSDGDSPMLANYDGPVSSRVTKIEPISLALFKSDGNEFTEDEYARTEVQWRVPAQSMIIPKIVVPVDDDGYYTIVTTDPANNALSYSIANTYEKSKDDNNILITVSLKDKNVKTSTNIRFIKDGELGTNGSKYSAIVTHKGYGYEEKDSNGRKQKLQLIYVQQGQNSHIWYKYNPGEESTSGNYAPRAIYLVNKDITNEFDIMLFADGEQITDNKKYTVEWSLVDDKYNYFYCPIKFEGKILKIKDNDEEWKINTQDAEPRRAIIQAKCHIKEGSLTNSEEYIYAYYPIEMTRLENKGLLYGIIPSVNEGYSEVIYASDGTNPKYNSKEAFELNAGLYNYNNFLNLYEQETVWLGCNNIPIPEALKDGLSKKMSPKTKYDNGEAVGNVIVQIGCEDGELEDMEAAVAARHEALNTASSNLWKKIESRECIKRALDVLNISDFIEKLDGEYKNRFYANSKFFLIKGNMVRIINDLISDIKEIKKIADKNNIDVKNIEIRKEQFECLLNDWYDVGTLKPKTEEFNHNFNALQIESKYLTLENIVKKKDKVATISVYDLINKYNNKVEKTYNNYYNEAFGDIVRIPLFKAVDENVSTLVKEIKDYCNINSYGWGTLNTEFSDSINSEFKYYLNIIKNLNAFSKFFNKDFAYTTDKIINRILNPMKVLLLPLIDFEYIINGDIEEVNKQKIIYEKIMENEDGNAYPTKVDSIYHVKPIMFAYNRYEMSYLNSWDGNKLTLGNDEGYVIAPQVGAGKKDGDLFTGITMGVHQVNVNNSNNQKIGLFGYHQGIQSLFLNANDGSAIFGKVTKDKEGKIIGGGQIIIDPSSTKALLYSSNFWIDYGPDGKPTSYNTGNEANKGMKIDLSTPEIKFGNGNFVVTSEGYLTAKGGGSIAGWSIGKTTLSSKNIILDSNGSIRHSDNKWSIDSNGDAIFKQGKIGGWKIEENKLSSNNIILDSRGSIKHSGDKWSIKSSGSATFKDITCKGVWDFGSTTNYWNSTNGFNLGNPSTNITTGNKGIKVDNDGDVVVNGDIYARNGIFNGTVYATDGKFKGEVEANRFTLSKTGEGHGVHLAVDASHYLYFGDKTESDHPTVSGLNVDDGGINMKGHQIGNAGTIYSNNYNGKNLSIDDIRIHSDDRTFLMLQTPKTATGKGAEFHSQQYWAHKYIDEDTCYGYKGLNDASFLDAHGNHWFIQGGLIIGFNRTGNPPDYTEMYTSFYEEELF